MKCETARDRLEVARPDGSDRNDPDLQDVFAHVGSCRPCEEVYQHRQEFDRQIGRVMRDVPVPGELKARILEALAEAEQPAAEATPSSKRPTPASTRRRWMKPVAAALLVLAAVGFFSLSESEPAPFAYVSLTSQLEARFASPDGFAWTTLSEFDKKSFDGAISDGRWKGRALPGPRGVDVDGDGRHDAAVYSISIQGGAGFLVVVEASRVTGPPTARSPFSTTPLGGPTPHVAWKPADDDHVYICYVDHPQPGMIQRLLDYVKGSTV